MMMKPNIIIYGLGKYFQNLPGEQKEKFSEFNIIGYCDRDRNFAEQYTEYIEPSDLAGRNYDFIVITSMFYREIVNSLINEYGADYKKIIIWEAERRKQDFNNPYGTFFAFGQFGEDYVIRNILKEKGIPVENATYIEIGVDNPFKGNNTYFLSLSGAEGILVEANPESINLIKVVRSNERILNKVVSDRKGAATFYIANDPALSSLSKENIELNGGIVQETLGIDSISINDILGMQEGTVVLSIDVEGYDKIVLQSIDFDLYQPEIICAEVGKPEKVLIEYMQKKGYCLCFCNNINCVWKRI